MVNIFDSKNSNRYSKSTTFITNFSVMLRSCLVHSVVDLNHGLKLLTQFFLVMMLSQLHVTPCSAGVVVVVDSFSLGSLQNIKKELLRHLKHLGHPPVTCVLF